MPFDNDEQRRAARARLQARMERRGSQAGTPPPDFTPQANTRATGAGRPDFPDGNRARRPRQEKYRGQTAPVPTESNDSGRFGGALRSIGERMGEIADSLPFPRRVVAIIAIAVLLLLVVVFAATHCAAPAPAEAESSNGVQAATPADSQDGDADGGSPDAGDSEDPQSEGDGENSAGNSGNSSQTSAGLDDPEQTIAELIGWDETDKLMDQARTNTDALWIAAHADVFAKETTGVQAKILTLAADEPKAVSYVRTYPDEYPLDESMDDSSIAMETGSPSPEVPNTNVPHFYQWDRRWGNTVYSSTAFALTGCGPTSYAMVYQGVTGKDDLDPYGMSQLAQKRGYMSEYNGTDASMFVYTADELGMKCEQVYSSKDRMISALQDGKVILARLSPGIFTNNGHFIVLTGLTDDGKVIINDPYSYERSSVTWDPDTLTGEANTFFIFSAK